jgi:hypothetical protein
MRKNTSMKIKVVVVLAKLGNENSLQMCGEVYHIAKSMTSIIVKKNCVAIRNHIETIGDT